MRRGATVRVPVICGDGRCHGIVGVGRGPVRFRATGGSGRWVHVRVARGARRVRVRAVVHNTRVHVWRRVVDRAPAGCAIEPWGRVLARDSGRVLFAVARPDVTSVYVCRKRRHLVHRLDQTDFRFHESITAAAMQGGAWAFTAFSSFHGITSMTLVRNGVARELGEASRVGKLLVTPRGAAVMADDVAGWTRIRVVDDAGDRILDAEPGIEPGSLSVEGETVRWRRDGAWHEAQS